MTPIRPGSRQTQEQKADLQIRYMSGLIQLMHLLRQAQSREELACAMVNDTIKLVPYRQAVFWENTGRGKIQIQRASGTEQVAANAPYILFLTRVITGLEQATESRSLSVKDVEPGLAGEWTSWLPEKIWVIPLIRRDKKPLGGLIFIRPVPWTQAEVNLLDQAAQTFVHAFQAFDRAGGFRLPPMVRRLLRPWRLALAAALILVLFLPIRLSVLAPMEIIPRDPVLVASPMDGAIKEFMVVPNQAVKAGDLLFTLDDIRLRNEHDIALKTLDVTRADDLRARQKAFADEASRAELLLLKARIAQQQATVDYLAEQLERSRVTAPARGVVVFNDVNDWVGKPVVLGEKIVTLADPGRVMAQIYLPVSDAITLKPGARIRIFLNISPDTPIDGRLSQAAYEARLTPDNILAFRLKADLSTTGSLPRIGLRGTAKIYGERVKIYYFLFRRPLAFLRQFLGA